MCRHGCGVVLDRRLSQHAEAEDGLGDLLCAVRKVLRALLACRACLNPRTVLTLGKAESPAAQGPEQTHWLLVTSGNSRASACSSLP